jgi:hypothetical protein
MERERVNRWIAPAMILAIGVAGTIWGEDFVVVVFGALFVLIAVADILFDPLYAAVGRWALRHWPSNDVNSSPSSDTHVAMVGFLAVVLGLVLVLLAVHIYRLIPSAT